MFPVIVVKIFHVMKTLAKIGLGLGTLVLAGLYSYQSSLIYPSSLNNGRESCSTPDEYGMDYELIELHTEDGETLQCFSLKQDKTSPTYTNKTIVVLSPNAGNIGHALPIVSIFYKNFGYNVFIYSYRGYGKSTGSPSEKGIKIDSQTVMKYLDNDEQYRESSVILYGRSLGGAVAIYMAATMSSSVSAVILENTFLSIRKTVPHIFPFLKYCTMFVHQIWDLESLVPEIPENIPFLLFSGRKDEIVPPEHMDKIRDMLGGDKTFVTFEQGTHNDTITQEGYWEKVQEFVRDKVNPVGY